MKIILKKKTPPWHKPAKVILVVAVIAFIFWQLKPQTLVEEHQVNIQPFVEDEMSRDGAFVHVNKISSIENTFSWQSDHELVFVGDHESQGHGSYSINIQSLTMSPFEGEVQEAASLEINGVKVNAYTLLYETELLRFFYVSDEKIKGIYQEDGEGIRQISSHMYLDNESQLPYFSISKDASKLVYFEDTTGKIVTYDFVSHKKKIIQKALTEDQLKALKSHVEISDLGGYVSFTGDDQLIYVYGADSGRVYVDGVMGINPEFSSGEKYFFYMYEGAMLGDFTGTQFGIVDFDNREINYDTSLDGLAYYADYAQLENDQVLYLTGASGDNDFVIDALVVFDPLTNEKNKSYALQGTSIKQGSPFEYSNKLILLEKTDGDYVIFNTETQKITSLTGLVSFIGDDGQDHLYLNYQEGFVMAYHNALYRYDPLGSTELLDYEGDLGQVSLSPNLSSIAVYVSGQGFIVSDKLSEQY